jgi:photosystem II stability/assembly factor-like uncharacterized protein
MIMKYKIFVVALFFHSAVLSQPLKLESIPVAVDVTFWSISAPDEKTAWVSASKGTVAISIDGGKNWTFKTVKGFESREFRSIYALDDKVAVIACVGSPAFILRTVDGGVSWSTVYENSRKEAFIDGIDFWNDKEGLAYGDPIDGRMLLLRTQDNGQTWVPDNGSTLSVAPGEASFASSGTGIRCIGDNTAIMATGGQVSRVLMSHDKGHTWQASGPMLRQGSNTGGIFSISFGNAKQGILVGGDFADSLANETGLYTNDGGKSWKKPRRSPGRSMWCVEFITASTAIAVGPSGGDITTDNGNTWVSLFDDKDFHVVRKSRKGSLVVVAGRKGKLAILK